VKCLIIAAGQGSRLRQRAESKPLVPINGTALIDRVIGSARNGGVDEFYVVSGYRGPMLRAHLDRYADEKAIVVNHVVNELWHEPNGVSVLQAKDALQEPFLLLMSDHLFDPDIVRELIELGAPDDGVVLATDSDLSNPQVDLDDVTRVMQHQGAIRSIGKGIEQYNAFDTGIFLCTPTLFDALEESVDRDGEASLSGGIRVLAESGRALTHDIGGRFWLDVDDSRTYVKAEVMLDQMQSEEKPEHAYSLN
jgi:1L-myo-inositol 1-phosphate cytidylyltransferase